MPKTCKFVAREAGYRRTFTFGSTVKKRKKVVDTPLRGA
jgi:hypothetical protein